MSEIDLMSVRIELQYKMADGKTMTTTMDIGDSKVIDSHNLRIENKFEKKRDPETKDIISMEPTGEHTLTLNLKYHDR